MREAYALYPAIFALISAIFGVFAGIWFGVISVVILSTITLICIGYFLHTKRLRQPTALILKIIVLLLFFDFGAVRGYLSNEEPSRLSSEDSSFELRINDIIDGDNSMRISGNIVAIYDSIGRRLNENYSNEVLITIQGVDYSLLPGVIIKIPNKFKLIENLGNPDEFDYKSYINRKGIFYRAYIRSNDFTIERCSPTLANKITRVRMWFNNKIMVSDLTPESKYFLSAVLIGDKHNLSLDTRNLYSNIGIAHILALSGLHVGIISMLVFLLLFPLDYIVDRRFRLVISIILLIAYAIITGLSVSVVRATLITLVCAVGFCLRRKLSSINLLAFVALVMILYNPLWLYDVGFQLSFMAVLFILLFAEKINFVNRRHTFGYCISGMVAVTISASLGTFMISAYYYHVIPILFLLPNIILIPVLPALILIGISAIATGFMPLIYLFDWSYELLNKTFSYISSLDFSYIDNVNITTSEVIMYYAIMLLVLCMMHRITKRIKMLTAVISCLLFIWFALFCITKNDYSSGLVVMNHYRETPLIIHDGSEAHLILPNDSIGKEYLNEFKQYNKSYLSKRNIKSIEVGADIVNQHISGASYFDFLSKRFVIVDNKLSKDTVETSRRMRCDYLVITKNYYASMNRILSKFTPDTIVLSGNIYPQRRLKLISQIREAGIPFYDINSEGAFQIEIAK